MRLQSGDGLLQAVHNRNNDILNSPKRINTLENSKYTQNTQNSLYYGNVTTTDTSNITDNIQQLTIEDVAALTNGQTDTQELRWCNSDLTTTGAQTQKLQYDNIQHHLVLNGLSNNRLNINSNLAARLQRLQAQNALNAPYYAQNQDQRMPQSPDDVLIDDDGANHSCCSSASVSPQEEDRGFDPSDSAESSDEGNEYSRPTTADLRPPLKGFVNPNYPGFQHLAHTLDFDEETLNNANNNNEAFEIHDKFDSVNRLDSVENIQKVFHEKSLDLDIDSVTPTTPLESTSNDPLSVSDGSPNNEDSCTTVNENFNIRIDETKVFDSVFKFEDNCFIDDNIQSSDSSDQRKAIDSDVTKSDVVDRDSVVGDFRKELEEELERVGLDEHCSNSSDKSKLIQATEKQLQETVEKLKIITELQPIQASSTTNEASAIQPSPVVADKPLVLQDSLIVKSPSKAKAADVVTVTSSPISLQLKKEETLARLSRNSKSKEEKMAQNVAMPMEVDTLLNLTRSDVKERRREVPSFLPLKPNVLQQIDQILSPIENKMADATLSSCEESISKIVMDRPKSSLKTHCKMDVDSNDIHKKVDLTRRDSNRELEEIEIQIKKIKSDTMNHLEEIEKFRKEEFSKHFKEKDDDAASVRKPIIPKTFVKKRRDYNQQFGSLITFPKRDSIKRDPLNRRSVPMVRERRKANDESFGGFDVYNIETAMPKIDLDAIENHLKAARDEERRRRIDREEIRRRLAMGNEDDYYSDRPGRKPSLQARLQSGMNLQICFMNETVSDNESPSSDNECPLTNPKPAKTSRNNTQLQKSGNVLQPAQRPATLALHPVPPPQIGGATAETDFFTKQARLQTEARMALAQAKEMARMQMEIEKQRQKKSPITEMVRNSLEKVGIPFPEEKRRLSRQILTDMNVAQLQVIVNDLHTQIETLNEQLVKFLMNRDDLHMEQDSMLVDIEDLTRYLGAKEQVLRDQLAPTPQNNNMLPPPSPAPSSPLTTLNNTVRPHLNRIASLVKK